MGDHDGETIYTTDEWEGAPVIQHNPPLHLAAGVSVHWVCTYDNQTVEQSFGSKNADFPRFGIIFYDAVSVEAGDQGD